MGQCFRQHANSGDLNNIHMGKRYASSAGVNVCLLTYCIHASTPFFHSSIQLINLFILFIRVFKKMQKNTNTRTFEYSFMFAHMDT